MSHSTIKINVRCTVYSPLLSASQDNHQCYTMSVTSPLLYAANPSPLICAT